MKMHTRGEKTGEKKKGPLPESNWRLAARYDCDWYSPGRLSHRDRCTWFLNRDWCKWRQIRVGVDVVKSGLV